MIDLLEKTGFINIELRKDIYGNDRMIKAEISVQ
jgi:release factor glutamine methyltransferase